MIKFLAIKDSGLIDQERIVYRAFEAGNIGEWMVNCTRSRLRDGKRIITNRVLATYWFSDRSVEIGDLVVIYTKSSKSWYKIKPASRGGVNTHFFYWGRDQTVWDGQDIAAVLGRFVDWSLTHVDNAPVDDVEPSDTD